MDFMESKLDTMPSLFVMQMKQEAGIPGDRKVSAMTAEEKVRSGA